MKHALSISALAAVYLTLSGQPVYALDKVSKCEAIFATPEHKASRKVSAMVAKRTAELTALQVWHEATKDGKTSIDPKLLLDAKLGGQPESKGITRINVTWLKGVFQPKAERETKVGTIFRPTGKPEVYGGRSYIEFPNSTMMTTQDATGKTRIWVLTRGVRTYKDRVNRQTGEINPRGYVSDVLLFEMVEGKPVFHSVYLESAPELKFLFEDPRISVVADGQGGKSYLLSGTDYSPHVVGQDNPKNDPDVMNRYIELKIDSVTGQPMPIEVDPVTKQPMFEDLSPAPILRKEAVRDPVSGKMLKPAVYSKIDAKNATVSVNEFGEVVVLARLRPDFNDREMLRLFDHHPWAYAEQVFIFKNWAEFKAYDRRDLMVDLAGKASSEKLFGAIRPVVAKELVRDSELKENLEVRAEDKEKLKIIPGDKGMGPGTRPVRVERSGDLLLVSDGPGLPSYIHDVILPSERAAFPMKDGEVVYTKLDHEIRKLKQASPTGWLKRRHYTATAKILNARMDEVTDYLPDVIQPKDDFELGKDSGILDLLHVYPMGVGIIPGAGHVEIPKAELARLAELRTVGLAPGASQASRLTYEKTLAEVVKKHGKAQVIATAGISDAHTSVWDIKWKVVIAEARAFTAKAASVPKP